MQLRGKAQRVIIYIGESDQYQGKPLYMALLQLLKREGASGATVVRGLAGFGARSRIHTATILTLSADLPLRLEWVDQPEIIARLLPQIRRMVDDGLITLEEVNVEQYAPGRQPDPLSLPVRDVMRQDVVFVSPETPVAEIVTLLLAKGYRSLPVVDEHEQLLGILTDGDLLRRGGLVARLDLQKELGEVDWGRQLVDLRQRQETAADLMSRPAIHIRADASLRQAMAVMVQRDLKRLPVLDEGRLVGWISRVDILHTLEYHQPFAEEEAEVATAGGSIDELMYRDVPTVPEEAHLEEIILALEKNRRRRAVVIDDAGQVKGIITDGDLLRRSHRRSHPSLLRRLRALMTGEPAEGIVLPEATETARELMSAPVISISLDTAPAEALRLMLQHGVKRLPVVDGEGRLLGLLGRASLLRALLPG